MQQITADIVIIGAGAAGLMAAFHAAKNGKKIIVLEHNDRPGRKILISGGGRCNFTNIYSNPNDFVSNNPHFCKSALSNYSPYDFLELLKQSNIPYFEKKLGQLFCKKSAKDIVNLLLNNLKKQNVEIYYKAAELNIDLSEEGFEVYNKQLKVIASKAIIATGGLSIKPIGATDFGHRVAKKFGHKIITTTPALVPFKLAGFAALKGVSLVAKIQCNGESICEDILFTHKGLSGPAILKISLYWNSGDKLIFNWLGEESVEELLKRAPGGNTIQKVFKSILPNSFVDFMLTKYAIDSTKKIATLNKKERAELIDIFERMEITPTGTEGFIKAEVTKGGVDTKDISSKTMESQLINGLYFIGEVLDVTGQLGGHNFQWAWASAYAAGKCLA